MTARIYACRRAVSSDADESMMRPLRRRWTRALRSIVVGIWHRSRGGRLRANAAGALARRRAHTMYRKRWRRLQMRATGASDRRAGRPAVRFGDWPDAHQPDD